MIWPEAQLAADIERVIAAPGAIDAEVFAGGQVRLLEYRLEPDSPLTAGPIASLPLPSGSNIVAVKRGDVISIPRGHTRLQPRSGALRKANWRSATQVDARPLSVEARLRQGLAASARAVSMHRTT